MKSVSTLKSNNTIESPKTPGGISKSLLTPCRRVGLSRNWKKSGPSPFISPLSGPESKSPVVEVKKEKRKRKGRGGDEENNEDCPQSTIIVEENNADDVGCDSEHKDEEIDTTPSRNLCVPRKKKSKILSQIVDEIDKLPDPIIPLDKNDIEYRKEQVDSIQTDETENIVVTPSRSKSKSKIKKLQRAVTASVELTNKNNEVKELSNSNKLVKISEPISSKHRSPENLTKECIVVIQKKIFKEVDDCKKVTAVSKIEVDLKSQVLFDSDSDDVPLSTINKKIDQQIEVRPEIINLDEDDDFVELPKVKVKKLEDRTTLTGGLKTKTSNKQKTKQVQEGKIKLKTECKIQTAPTASSQSSFDDDDFVMDSKRTILIRKTYEKVNKPIKAKSTGSVTQKDIDELKARIEMKKKMLLAKAVSEDTEELRDLIKKWQRGCQDALMELMELMKNKCPDKQNMDYSEILKNLKIPPKLVGYDEENDCFSTPTDENIILSKFND